MGHMGFSPERVAKRILSNSSAPRDKKPEKDKNKSAKKLIAGREPGEYVLKMINPL